jgi:hypothetical protein
MQLQKYFNIKKKFKETKDNTTNNKKKHIEKTKKNTQENNVLKKYNF